METTFENRGASVSWRSVIAGLFVTFLVMSGLGALGMAFGGSGLYDGTTLKSASMFTGIWFLVTVALSLMAGAYFASRISRMQTPMAGRAHGLTLAAIFFAILIYQAASTVGWLGRAAGSAVSSTATLAAEGVSSASNSTAINQIVEDTLGDLNIQPERIQAVVTGVATRLASGNTEGAKTYLARQAGITPADADARIANAKVKADQALISARETAAKTLQTSGWLLLALIVIGSITSVVGGVLGARLNMTAQPVMAERKTMKQTKLTESYV